MSQYTSRTVPGAVDVLGSATNTATVTVNNLATSRHGNYYHQQLPIDNSAGAVWQSITNTAVLNQVSDVKVSSQTNHIYVPQSPESYTYDAEGNRMVEQSETAVYYLVDDRNPSGHAQVLAEHNEEAEGDWLYTFGLGLVAETADNGDGTHYYGWDGHGSTRFLTDETGTIANTYTYDAYGSLVASNVTVVNFYRYCGEQWDTDLGMYYLRARYLLPDTGRFWTMDTNEGFEKDPLSLHKYLYCELNPINHKDPSGLKDYNLVVSYGGAYDDTFSYWDDGQSYADIGLTFAYIGQQENTIIVADIRPEDDIYTKVAKAISKRDLVLGTDHITDITVDGHGAPGIIGNIQSVEGNGLAPSCITLASLKSSINTPQQRLLAYLQPFTHDNCKVYLEACRQADGNVGQEMMMLIAKQLGPNVSVIGWAGTYAVIGTGGEFTATWDGTTASPSIQQTAPSYNSILSAAENSWGDNSVIGF